MFGASWTNTNEPRTIDTKHKAVVCPKAHGRLLLKRRLTMKEIKRGEIYAVDFGTGFGSEQGGTRPSLILQNDIGNRTQLCIKSNQGCNDN